MSDEKTILPGHVHDLETVSDKVRSFSVDEPKMYINPVYGMPHQEEEEPVRPLQLVASNGPEQYNSYACGYRLVVLRSVIPMSCFCCDEGKAFMAYEVSRGMYRAFCDEHVPGDIAKAIVQGEAPWPGRRDEDEDVPISLAEARESIDALKRSAVDHRKEINRLKDRMTEAENKAREMERNFNEELHSLAKKD